PLARLLKSKCGKGHGYCIDRQPVTRHRPREDMENGVEQHEEEDKTRRPAPQANPVPTLPPVLACRGPDAGDKSGEKQGKGQQAACVMQQRRFSRPELKIVKEAAGREPEVTN